MGSKEKSGESFYQNVEEETEQIVEVKREEAPSQSQPTQKEGGM